MRRSRCQLELKRGTTTFTNSRNGYCIALQDIPAWVCTRCGEPMYDADAVSGIQDVLQTVDERLKKFRNIA